MFDMRPKVDVCIAQTGESYACATSDSLLAGMVSLGRRGIPVGCVNGGCGVCKVRVVEGSVRLLGPLSRAHVSTDDECRGYTLACRAAPVSAVRLEVASRCFEKFFCKKAVEPESTDQGLTNQPGDKPWVS